MSKSYYNHIEAIFLFLHDVYDFESGAFSYIQSQNDGSISILRNGATLSNHTVDQLMLAYGLNHMDDTLANDLREIESCSDVFKTESMLDCIVRHMDSNLSKQTRALH